MAKISVTHIVNNVNKAVYFEWIVERFDRSRFDLSFILLNPGSSQLEQYLIDREIPMRRVEYRGKRDLPVALPKIMLALRSLRTDVIHTHLFEASLSGMIAARAMGIRKRVCSRHHADLHHKQFPRAVKYDQLVNALSTDILAISRNVERILLEREHANPRKVSVVYNGYDTRKFENVSPVEVERFRQRHGLVSTRAPTIGVIARYVDWKGVQFILPAFKRLLTRYPEARIVLANASGPMAEQLRSFLATLPPGSFLELPPFTDDIYPLYKTFDVYVHAPVDAESEAFGATYIEALAAGVPSVFTLSGIAREFIEHRKNALTVDFSDSDQIYEAMVAILEEPGLARSLVTHGRESVRERFDVGRMVAGMESCYLR